MVKVLVVDDSAFMRNAISTMLASDPHIKVIGTARDGIEAIAKVKTLKPDIVTLDVEMPRMDGIEALRHIMAENPLPVVMLSSLTSEGAEVTLQALEIGALDFIPKNLSNLSVNILKIKEVLLERIKYLARRGVVFRPRKLPLSKHREPDVREVVPIPSSKVTAERRMGVVAIGTSTGGPKALQEILPRLPNNFPVPIVIAQHMPPNFTGPFAQRLNQLSQIEVREATDGDVLRPGLALVAPGNGNMRVVRTGAIETVARISESREEFVYRPSVDALMLSVAEVYPGRTLGVILTGMGNDGLEGIKSIKDSGGRVFAQEESSCVVYGMPKAVVDAGLVDKVLDLGDIAGELVNSV
jgi:two-component system chemotaxis response regulator CheB